MQIFIVLLLFAGLSSCAIIRDNGAHHATSYQSVHMEHYKADPIYVKKATGHSYSEGQTDSELQIHHGSKHEPGYAVANIHSEIFGHPGHGHRFVAEGGHSSEYQEDASPEHEGYDANEAEHAEYQYSDGQEARDQDEGEESAENSSYEGGQHDDGYYTSGEEESY